MIRRCEEIFSRAASSIFVSSSSSALEHFARLLPDRVAVLLELALVEVGQRVCHHVRQFVELVARDPHSTALYLRASSIFTFLNISG